MLQTTTTRQRVATPELAQLTEEAERASWHLARTNFAAFRAITRPDMVWGWWVERLALELQNFYARMRRGMRPKLAIMAPPQHGKSWAATDFISWVAGRDPSIKT